MTEKRNPTNSDLMKEIQAVQANLANHNTRIIVLEAHKIATDAVAEYLKANPAVQQSDNKITKELIKYMGIALSIISALVLLLTQGMSK